MRSGRSVIARSIASIFSSKSAHHSPPPPPRQRFAFESLESRLLLSADPAAAGSLVVVDGAIGDQAGRFSGAEVLILDQNRDGLEQITQALAARSGSVSALHIVSHGASGSLALGATTLDAASLEGHQAQLRAWADALTADADILFYGCNVAADEAGIGFIEELSRLSGADIAASTDLTGSADLGGDWELEYATGSIEADAIASSASDLILATVNYNAATDTLTFTADAAQVDAVTITSPVANQLRIAVNADTLVLTGDTAAGFTLNAANNQLDIDTSAALISVFDLLLEDQNDTVNFTNNAANGLGAVSIVGGAGNETVTLNAITLAGNLSLGVEAVTVATGANVNVGTNAITATGSNVTFGGASPVTVTAATFSAGSLNISAGQVNLNAGTTAGTLSLGGAGNLSGTGAVTVTGLTTWSAGTMSGTGTTNTDGGMNITTAGQKTLSGGRTLNTALTTNWSGSTSNFTGEIIVLGGASINNSGTWNDQHGFTVRLQSSTGGGSFDNDGTYTKTGAGRTEIGVGFSNTGVVNVDAGTLALGGGGTHTGSFGGAGTLEFSGGTHTLEAASSITTANATFSSVTSTGTANINGTYNVAGTTRVSGGTVNFLTPATDLGTTLIVTGGTGNLGTTSDALTTLTVGSGAGGTLSSAGTLTVSGATTLLTSGTITGTGVLTAAGLFTWSGGTMSGTGTTNSNGGMNINTAAQKNLSGGRTLNTALTTNWSGSTSNNTGEITVTGGSSINNSGTWNDQHAFTVRMNGSGTNIFNNDGTYTKTGAGRTEINVGFNNTASGAGTGVVSVDAGTLALGNGGTHSGSFSGAGTLEFSGGAHTLGAASSIATANATFSNAFSTDTVNVSGTYNVAGTTRVSGGTVNFLTPATDLGTTLIVTGGTANLGTTSDALTTLTVGSGAGGTLSSAGTLTVSGATTLLTSGAITGTGVLTAAGLFTWSGGTMNGAGTTNSNGGMNIGTNAQKTLSGGRTLNTAGVTNWSGSTSNFTGEIIVSGGSRINNSGTWNDLHAFTVRMLNNGGTNVFNNDGTYTKTGAGRTEISIGFNTPSADVVNVDAGTLALGGGGTHTGSFGGAGTLEFSGGTHTLEAASSIATANATFSNVTSTGTANINGTYNVAGTTRVSGGTVSFLTPATDLGTTLIVTGGTANLGTTSDALTTLTVGSGSGGTLSSAGTLTVSGATTLLTSGTITGTGVLTAAGLFTWSGGTMSGAGTTNSNGGMNISTNGQKTLSGGRTVNTAGITNWSGSTSNFTGEIIVSGGSSINNSGTWNDQHGFTVRMLGSTGGGSFDNDGTYTKSGAGRTEISVGFNNTSSGAGTGVVNVDAGTLALGGGGTHTGSFSGAGTLEFSGGTHTLEAASSITTANATFSNDSAVGTANIDGTYNVAGTTRVSGGTVNFLTPATDLGTTLIVTGGTANLGTTSDALTTLTVGSGAGGTLSSAGTLTVSGATTLLTSGTITGTGVLTAAGLFTWSGGTMSGAGTTNSNGGMNISTNGQKTLSGGRTVNTAGITNWSGSTSAFTGEIIVSGGSSINNSGTWNDQHGFTVRMLGSTGGGSFDNDGTYTKSGAGRTEISVGFNNTSNGAGTGVVNVDAGTLDLGGGGTHTGSFATVAGTTLELSGGTHNLNNASAVSSLGRLLISGGTVNTAGTLTAGGLLQMTAGTLNAGGTVDATTYSQSGGALAGTGTVSVSGQSTWTGGTMSGTGTTNTGGGLNITGPTAKLLSGGRTLNTAGTTNWSGSTSGNTNEIIVSGGASINNNGTWNDQNAHTVRLINNGGAGSFDNDGTYTKSGASETQIGIGFNNAGVVNVNGGTLSLDAGGVSSGDFNVGSGILEFGGGVHELQAASSVSGPGATVRFDGGTVNVAGSYSITGTTSVTGATANFVGTINAVGALAITSGNANFSSGELIQASTLNLGTSGTLSGSDTVSVTGLSTWTGGTMTGTGTTNTDGGLNITGPTAKIFSGGRTLNTAGTTNWSGSTSGNTNEIIVLGGASINNSGTWNDQNAHTVRLLNNGGAGSFDNDGTYTKSGAGETQISVAFDNGGTLNIQAGTLNFSGSLVQTGTIDIASGATLFKASGGLNNNGGVISGGGTIDLNTGTLTSSGTILPGGLGSAGVLTLEGNLTLTMGSVINFDLASGIQYDAINVTGTATLDGDANIFHLGGFVPTEDDAFVVIQAASVIGTFDNVIPPDGFEYTTVYGADHVTFHLSENEEPVAVNDSFSTAEDTALIVAGPGVLGNDTDPDVGDLLTAILATGPAHGTLTLDLDGSFTYTPDLNFFGTDSFTYRAFDGRLPSDLATVSLTITPVNDTPVANNDSATTNEDFAVTVAVRSNDTDVDFNALTVSQFTQGANGTVVLRANGNLIYTPNANFFGTDTFTYRVRDTGLLESNEATVSVTVAPVADFSFAFLTPTSGVGEAGGTAVLTVVLTTDTALNSNVLIDLTAPGMGSAILGADYTFTNPTTLTFLAGSITGATSSTTVAITNDRAVETIVETADFSFGNIRATGLGVNAGAATGSHTVSITDNDSAAVAITAPGTTSVTEAGGSANVGVTLTLTTDGTGTEQLDVEVLANLPGNGDYAATTALFGVGASNGATADVVVTAVNDRNVEQATESFAGQALSVTSTANASASTSQTIDVVDNDSAAVVITTPGTTSVTESGASANVGVTLMLTTDGTVGTAQLDVAVAANLPGNADYSATGVVFGVGAISGATADVVVAAVNDRRVEQATESFAGQVLSVTSTADTSTSTSQTIDVTDNDSASVAIASPGTTSVTEGGASANVGVTLTLTTDGVGSEQLDVQVAATLPGNADYAATAAVFDVGSVSGAAADVVVSAVNDRRVEQASESFTGQDLSVTSTASASASTSQTIQVTDNDSASVAIASPGTTSVTEGEASANVGVTLTLITDGAGTEQLDVQVAANLPGNADYAATGVVFGVGSISGDTASVVVTAVNDRRVEQATEIFAGQALSVTSTAAVSASTSQTINVVDNDSASVAITAPGTSSVTEGGASANVGVTLTLITDGAGTEELDVELAATLPGNGDYTATAAVFGVGSISGDTADVVVTAVNDRNVEQSTESFAGQALSVTSLASASASTSQAINVTDNDSASVAITAPGTTSVAEGGASANVGVTLTLTTDGVGTEQLDVELVASLPGNADYAATAVVFGVGAISGDAADMVVTAVNDRRVEQVTESFTGQALSVTSTASASASTSQTIDVVDNDSASVAITSPGTTSVIEGRTLANVGVTLTLTTDGTVGTEQLDVEVAANLPGNGDYAATGVVFGIGAISGATAGVVVTAVNDRNVEQATESFAGQALSVTSTANASASTSQTINVMDNDSAAVVITTLGPTSVSEGGGSANVGVVLMLTTNGTVGTEQLDVAVAANLLGNADYAATGVVFGIGAISGDVADVAVTALNDRNVEQATEVFAGQALSVTSTANASASTSQTIEVTDNDSASVAISAPGTTSVTEGGASANVGVTLLLTTDGVGTEQLDVAVAATLPGNDDYAAAAALFGVGAVSGATADVVVSAANDVMVEQAVESFAGQALSVGSTANVSASTSQTIEVADNDTAVYTINDVTVSEADGTLTFTVSLSNPVDIEVAIDVSYADQTATGAAGGVGADYDNDLDQVVFAALDMSDKQVTVAITDDSITEAAETFLASLSTATALGGRSIDVSDTGIGTIANDDANNAPVAVDDTYTTNEDMQLLVDTPGVLGNDTDADLDALTAQLVTGPVHGTLVFGSDGSFAYTPDLNFSGSDSFAYRVSDGVLSDDGLVTITVNAVNDAPDAQDDTYTTDEDVALTIAMPGLLANDTDVDSALTAILETGPANGTLVLNADGSFTYTPNLNFNGTDSFTYRASDGPLSDLATVLLTVNAVNDAPDAQDDTYTIDEDTVLTVSVPGVLANDADVDSTLTAVLETGPANGTLVFSADGSFTYTPNLNFNGTDSFTYRASDGPESDLATVLLTVNAVNDAPVGTVPGAQTATEDTPLLLTGATRLNVADVDATNLTATLSVTAGALTLGGIAGLTFSSGDGTGDATMTFSGTIAAIQTALTTVTFNPAINSTGTATLTLSLNDNGQTGAGGALTDTDNLTISINAVNDAPVAVNDAYTTDEDTLLTVLVPGVLANDIDVDSAALAAVVATGPANGTLVLNPDGSFTYTPNLNFNGTDSFTYRASDAPGSESGLATVLLTVNAVNDAPVGTVPGPQTATEDTPLLLTGATRLNVADVDATNLTVTLSVDAGALTLGAVTGLTFSSGDGTGDGTMTFSGTIAAIQTALATVAFNPAINSTATATLTLALSDNGQTGAGGALTDSDSVSISISPVNDAPDAQDDTYTAFEDFVLVVNAPGVLGNDSDVDSVLSAAVVDDVDHGTLSLAADGSFLYVADLNFFGTDTFIYEVSDGQGGTDTATVTITVEAVNDPVLAVDDAAATAEDTALSVPVVANDEDADGDVLFVTDVGLAANGTVTFSGGAVIYTPNANFHGTDTFEYTVSDGEDIDTGLVTVTVTPVNDAPVAVDDMATTDEDLAVTIAVLSNDTDVDLDTLTVAGVTQGANGSVAINPGGTVSYTPNAGFSGSDSFTYTVSDGQGGTDTGLVTVTVDQADDNDAPVFVEVADRTITEGQEVRFTIVATDADDPAGALVYSVTSGLPAGATFNAATREFVWVPADEEGAEVTTLSFTVLDPDGATDTMDVVLTVTNAKPTVDAGANQVVGLQKVDDDHGHDHGYKKGEAEVSIKATFNDLGTRDTHTATIDWGDGKVTSGSVSESPFGPPGSTAGANGSVTGSHTYKKAGVYTVKVTVKDDDGAYRTDTLTVTVKDPDKHLRARGDEYKLREDGVLQVNAANGVLRNDRAPGSLPLTARLVEGPDHGALVFNADGSFTYRPDANFHGEDSFWYEFTDGSNVSKAVKVELDVKSDGRHEACIDWGGHGGWHGGHFGGGQHANFVEFLIKLARKFD